MREPHDTSGESQPQITSECKRVVTYQKKVVTCNKQNNISRFYVPYNAGVQYGTIPYYTILELCTHKQEKPKKTQKTG